jgi:mRNA-degrading endonuclease RelE of RelBE toxin-antitoxin system
MPYEILVTSDAKSDLSKLRVYDRRRILDGIEEQLTHQPSNKTRNRKPLELDPDLIPLLGGMPPIWELRIDEFRVFYDVSESEQMVVVRRALQKRTGQSTEDMIRENNAS